MSNVCDGTSAVTTKSNEGKAAEEGNDGKHGTLPLLDSAGIGQLFQCLLGSAACPLIYFLLAIIVFYFYQCTRSREIQSSRSILSFTLDFISALARIRSYHAALKV